MNKAEKLMENGDYISASKIYLSINSEDAQEKYNECIYTYANNLHNAGDYENAISQIDSISYKDSSELSKAWNYEYALYNVKTGNYKKAIELFESLESYNGSEFKAKELSHYYGTKLYNEKNFKDAATYLGKFSKDAPLYNNALYNYAIELTNNKNLIEAYDIFQDLAKIPYYNSADMAKTIFTYIFLRGGNIWSYSPQGFDDTFQYIFFKDKFFFYAKKNNASSYYKAFTFESLLVTSADLGVEDAKEAIILTGINENNPQDIVFLKFDIINNSKVAIHSHFSLTENEKCVVGCGVYNATHTLDFSKYPTKYKYYLTEVPLPQLSFASEVQNIPTSTVNTNIQNPETSNIATESEQNTTLVSSELNTTAINSESNTDNQNYTSVNNTTTKSSNEDFVEQNNYAHNQNTVTNNSNNTQKPTVPTSSQDQSVTSPVTSYNPRADGRSWKELTSTVHHEEVGHYEDKEIAYKVEKYKCALCHEKFNSLDEYYKHFDSSHNDSLNIEIFRELYEIVDDWEYTNEKQWVVDTEAYDETITTGYKCSVCEKTKK